jgi:hypothetical protein
MFKSYCITETKLFVCVLQRKCDMYWPKEGMETFGIIQVKLLQEVTMATYTLRTFNVKNLKVKKVFIITIKSKLFIETIRKSND